MVKNNNPNLFSFTMKKEYFSLKINIAEINARYNIICKSTEKVNDDEKDISVVQTNLSTQAQNVTSINDILMVEKKSNQTVSFLDLNKKLRFLYSSTIDLDQELCCHWCTLKITTEPIGCPVKYEKEKYVIDGVFCSFNCCYAFILENQNKILYRNSINLLHSLYLEVNPSVHINTLRIYSAPHWRMLKKFGGFMTEVEFKQSFSKEVYTKTRNCMIPVVSIYEKQEIF